jgi:hypothetical protein
MNRLEVGMQTDRKLLKKLIEICPQILQHPQAIDIIAQYKKKKK